MTIGSPPEISAESRRRMLFYLNLTETHYRIPLRREIQTISSLRNVLMENQFKLRNQSRLFYAVVSICLLFLITSCSSAPSESLAIDYINRVATSGYDNLFRLRSLTKTNGMGNSSSYIMEYTFELECLKTNIYTPNPSGGYTMPQFSFGATFECTSIGQTISRRGHLRFENTENGWRVHERLASETWASPRP